VYRRVSVEAAHFDATRNRRPRVTGRLRRKLLSRGKRNRHASKFVTLVIL